MIKLLWSQPKVAAAILDRIIAIFKEDKNTVATPSPSRSLVAPHATPLAPACTSPAPKSTPLVTGTHLPIMVSEKDFLIKGIKRTSDLKPVKKPLQKPFNQGRHKNISMSTGFTIGEARIVNLFGKDSEKLLSRPVTILGECVAIADQVERNVRAEILAETLQVHHAVYDKKRKMEKNLRDRENAERLAEFEMKKRRRIEYLQQQQQQQKTHTNSHNHDKASTNSNNKMDHQQQQLHQILLADEELHDPEQGNNSNANNNNDQHHVILNLHVGLTNTTNTINNNYMTSTSRSDSTPTTNVATGGGAEIPEPIYELSCSCLDCQFLKVVARKEDFNSDNDENDDESTNNHNHGNKKIESSQLPLPHTCLFSKKFWESLSSSSDDDDDDDNKRKKSHRQRRGGTKNKKPQKFDVFEPDDINNHHDADADDENENEKNKRGVSALSDEPFESSAAATAAAAATTPPTSPKNTSTRSTKNKNNQQQQQINTEEILPHIHSLGPGVGSNYSHGQNYVNYRQEMEARERRLVRKLTHAIGYVIVDVLDIVPNILVQEDRNFATIARNLDMTKGEEHVTKIYLDVGRILATVSNEGVLDSLDQEASPYY